MRHFLLLFLTLATAPARAENAPNRLKDWQIEIARQFKALYAPLMQSTGRSLELIWRQESPLDIATVDTDGKNLKILVDGGLLRSPRLTPDGFRFILCHEMGHLLGGAPRRGPPPEWDGPLAPDGLLPVSAEGQSDYYASLSCFRRLVQGQDHARALTAIAVSPRLKRLCDRVWGDHGEGSLVCQRASLGGWNLLQLVKEFPISFETPDDSVAPAIIRDIYPPRQCRLDTILAGALCKSEVSLELDFNVGAANDCPEPTGRRPVCWYPR